VTKRDFLNAHRATFEVRPTPPPRRFITNRTRSVRPKNGKVTPEPFLRFRETTKVVSGLAPARGVASVSSLTRLTSRLMSGVRRTNLFRATELEEGMPSGSKPVTAAQTRMVSDVLRTWHPGFARVRPELFKNGVMPSDRRTTVAVMIEGLRWVNAKCRYLSYRERHFVAASCGRLLSWTVAHLCGAAKAWVKRGESAPEFERALTK
jgi:hypothetical protein